MNDRSIFNISGKGVPVKASGFHDAQILSVPFNQIAGFVQNVSKPELLTIYYKKWGQVTRLTCSTYLPQHFNAINAKSCNIMVSALNSPSACSA